MDCYQEQKDKIARKYMNEYEFDINTENKVDELAVANTLKN